MPFIQIRALPPAGAIDVGDAVRAVSAGFAAATATDERHVTVTWEELAPDSYSQAGDTAATQPRDSYPVLVEVFAPDLSPQERVETMLEVAAREAAAAGVAMENVFVHFRAARSGQVFEEGAVARW